MKHLPFLLVLLFSFSAIGQEVEPTPLYLNTFLSTDNQNFSAQSSFDSFLEKLEKKRTSIKKEKDFVRYVFSKTHQEYLKKYEPYASFSNLFNGGAYNCLTGTILYAVVLNHFDLPYEVIETNYHIFLTVETAQGKVLLEATDPLNGFVETTREIEKRIGDYKQNTLTASNSKIRYHQFNFDLYRPVSMEELRGLLYYNKAVDSYNHQKLAESIQYLVQAHELYVSSRTDEFSMILLRAVQQSDWSDELKEKSIKIIYSVGQKNSSVIASLSTF